MIGTLTVQPHATAYPDTYPVHYALHADGRRWAAASTVEGLAKFAAWDQCSRSRIIAEQIAPDGSPVLLPPNPGAIDTYAANAAVLCLSSAWVRDEDEQFAPARLLAAFGDRQDPRVVFDHLLFRDFHRTAEQWLNNETAGHDGFRVRCRHPFEHDGPCRNGPFAWDLTTGPLPYTPLA